MTRFNWTPEHSRILHRMAADGATSQDVADAVGCTTKLAYLRSKREGVTLKRVISPKFVWTPELEAVLVARYESEPAIDIAHDVGCSLSALYQRAYKLGCRKTTEFAREITRRRWAEGRHDASLEALEKGRGWNKGIKGSTGTRPACRKNHFRQGQMPYNHAPIGSLRIAGGHLQRKVGDFPKGQTRRNWAPVHRLVWEAAHGQVPAGHVVRFREGRHTTVEAEITPDRLECVTRRENMQRNSRHNRYPPELNQLIQLRGCMNRKINSRAREAQPK